MFRNAVFIIACLGVALASQSTAVRAADADPLVGSWQVDHDGFHEVWTIGKTDKGDWSVGGVFQQKGQEVGSWQGADVKAAGDGKMTCTQNWVKKPDPTWGDATQVTAQAAGDKLRFVWDNGGGNSGTRDMARVKAGAADGSDLIGTWKAEHDGYLEVWNIQMSKGAWAVGGGFFKKGKQVGAWQGADAAFADGKLTCTQKYLVKPVASWSDNNKMTVQMSNDKPQFTWDNGAQSGTREMTKVSK